MTKTERIKFLGNLIAEDPEDPFAHYALCLENEFESGRQQILAWEAILAKFPEYLPSYYQAGLAYQNEKDKENAIRIWKHGLALAMQQNNRHTLAELRSAIQNAMFDEEE